jgi:hydrogenase-4 component B
MTAPMGVLVACCFFIGLAPTRVAPVLEQAVSAWAPEVETGGPLLTALAPLASIGTLAIVLLVAMALTSLLLWNRLRGSVVETGPTWGCGFAAPTSRMQYTSSSFGEMLVGLFGWALRPRTHLTRMTEPFPQRADFHSEIRDPVLDEAVLPAFEFVASQFAWFRRFQQGRIQTYLLYIFATLVALLLWPSIG